MSSFTGVSVVTGDGRCTTSAVDADTDSGYHLLVVKDYSRTVEAMPNGKIIRTSVPFMVGGHKWHICYCPKGFGKSSADYISLFICPSDDDEHDIMEEDVELKYQFSFVDQVEYQKPTHVRATETISSSDPVGDCSEFMKRDALEWSAHLKGDGFTIRCDIMVCEDLSSHDADGAMPDIHQHFDHLLQNKVGADVTFEVSGEEFAAHRCVLAARSKVFMAQLFGPMTEGTTSTVIRIEDMEAKVFADLLRFIYTDTFPEMDKDNNMEEGKGKGEVEGKGEEEGKEEEEGQDEEESQDEEEGQEEDVMWLQWLQDLLVAADKYDLQRLKFLCGKQLSEHIGVSSVVSTLALAEQHHCHRLKEACFKFIQVQSPKCLDKVMATDGWEHMVTTYPSVLKELVAKLVANQKEDKRRKQSRM